MTTEPQYESVVVRRNGGRWYVTDAIGGEALFSSTSEHVARAYARGVDYGYEAGEARGSRPVLPERRDAP